MKLRLKSNSIRLRLTKGEVARFASEGVVEESIEFGSYEDANYCYRLIKSTDAESVFVSKEQDGITIFVPSKEADEWTKSDRVSIESSNNVGGQKSLSILIEKDFTCLKPREGEDDLDAYPHPLAGQKC